MIETQDLRVGYYPGLDILQGVTLTAAPGRVTAVLGANGVGKSTLLKAIYGFLKPTAGRVLVDDAEITTVSPHRMVAYGLTYAPQQPGIFADMSVEENVLLGAWSFRRDHSRVKRKLEENYDRFPILKDRRRSQALTLSGGQRRMVELARAMMTDPRYLLIDEPSAGVAPTIAEIIYATLAGLRDAGVGILLVDQDINRAMSLADYVYIIDLGRKRREGTPSEFPDLVAAFWWD